MSMWLKAVGIMERNGQKRIAITRVVLRPTILWDGESPSQEQLDQLHEKAHKYCFIANSVDDEDRDRVASLTEMVSWSGQRHGQGQIVSRPRPLGCIPSWSSSTGSHSRRRSLRHGSRTRCAMPCQRYPGTQHKGQL